MWKRIFVIIESFILHFSFFAFVYSFIISELLNPNLEIPISKIFLL